MKLVKTSESPLPKHLIPRVGKVSKPLKLSKPLVPPPQVKDKTVADFIKDDIMVQVATDRQAKVFSPRDQVLADDQWVFYGSAIMSLFLGFILVWSFQQKPVVAFDILKMQNQVESLELENKALKEKIGFDNSVNPVQTSPEQ